MNKVALLFGVHAHQPAGNFAEVIDAAHERCYGPFLRVLAEVPRFPFAVHFSGPLLDQLAERYPADIGLLAEMVARGQAEMFGAGDTEPVLAAIPHRDRVAQIERLSEKLAARFGTRPAGAWLTERVWESSVVPALAETRIRYVTVDDYHFLATGRQPAELGGYFTTEEDGRTLDVFPISEELRYRLPFATAAEAVTYIESLADAGPDEAAVYFDDIEKFGVWPETYAWVYERGWLREFLDRVLASPRIEVMTFAQYHARARTRGVVYLPTTSYIEMNEWSLPAEAADRYAALVGRERDGGRFADVKGFLRGGIWRNFLARYPEANWMHKRMLALSARLAARPTDEHTESLRSLLHLAQANDAYWHGLFGGLYLPHLRRSVWKHLLELERALDREGPRPARSRADLDHDGHDDVHLVNDALHVAVRLDGTGTVRELSSYALAQNFGDTLRRHREHYHRRVLAGATETHATGDGIASAHDRVAFKHPIGPEDLAEDPLPRDMFRDMWIETDGTRAPLRYTTADADDVRLDGSAGPARIAKRVAIDGAACTVAYRVAASRAGRLEVVLDVAMPSCDGYAGRFIVGGHVRGGLGQTLALDDAHEITLDDRFMGGAVVLRASRPTRIAAQPHHTVSQSEEGYERVMQSVTLTCAWDLPAGDATIDLTLDVRADAN